MGDSAVPRSTQASQPALQWVSTLTRSPGCLRAAIASISFAPCTPMARLVSTSASQISAARA